MLGIREPSGLDPTELTRHCSYPLGIHLICETGTALWSKDYVCLSLCLQGLVQGLAHSRHPTITYGINE